MPSLSPTMKAGKITKWHKKEGDSVKEGEVIADIETDKAVMEFESFEEGVLAKIVKNTSEEIGVGEVIAVLQLEDDSQEDIERLLQELKADTKTIEHNVSEKSNNDGNNTTNKTTNDNNHDCIANSSRRKISPAARFLAKNKNLDIAKIESSGPGGRIIKRDVIKYLEKPAPTNNQQREGQKKTELRETSEMRKIIARRLLEAKTTIPHFYLTVSCEVDEIIKLRKNINDEQIKITVNDFVIKACALAIEDLPEVNISWQDEQILKYNTIDIAVAVSLEEGLITPIVFAADMLSLQQVSTTMKDLAHRAKKGALKPHEFQGGGMTVTNLGMFNIENFQAIINPPQASILAVGGISKTLSLNEDGKVTEKNIIKLTLSVDHRAIDGVLAAKFLNKIKFYLANPLKILVK